MQNTSKEGARTLRCITAKLSQVVSQECLNACQAEMCQFRACLKQFNNSLCKRKISICNGATTRTKKMFSLCDSPSMSSWYSNLDAHVRGCSGCGKNREWGFLGGLGADDVSGWP